MFDLQPWQSWEKFGACFYAVRINALLALGYSTVTLGDLLPGTRMSGETRNISVKLVPSRVFRSSACARVNASVPREAFVLSEVGKPQRVALWVAKVHGRAIEELGNHERNNGVWNSPPTSSSLYL
ncbi:hypothetical protein PC116_g21620 [Phytophthora cactorum]|nr:hypothetical protein PC116_g21620 [Phytophthora cactorum]